MIKKQYKLTTKEVNYLMRRKQSIYVDGYKILRCDQYPNNSYHQTWIQVSGKIHKHAVQRNIIRRAFYAAWEDQIDKVVHNHYYKIFIVIHPEHCESINHILQIIKPHQELKHHFSQIILSSLWKLSKLTSRISSPQQRPYGTNSNLNHK